jgi:alpha-D-xyloside xylohydrolase
MKFTNGYWNIRDGYQILNSVDVREVRTNKESVTVFAATKAIKHRGDTLNQPMLTLNYSSPMKNVIRVKVVHDQGQISKGPAFSINETEPIVFINDNDEFVSLQSGDLCVKINKIGSWKVDYDFKGKRLTGNAQNTTGYVIDKDGKSFVREQLDLDVGEYVYGLGERFTPYVKNGQVVDIWNDDGGTSSELAYKNIPFYITNKGYGVFVNDPGRVSYEIASEVVSRAQFSVSGESLEYFIIAGPALKDVLKNYTAMTGRASLPPAWTFGLWLTTSFTTNYDEQTVNSFIDGMAARDLPLHVFHFDCFWMKEFQWCDFEWDKAVFPDPENMLKRLKNKGLRICVWINSYIAQKSYMFKEGMDNGYLLKTKDGSVYQWDKWQAGMGLVDFTNPDAVKWFQSKLQRLVEMGVDCFKTDFGERIPEDAVYFDGSDPLKMHNYYTFLYNKAVFEVLEKAYGKNKAALFARSATAGGQQFPVHWGGDCSATYQSMAETLRGGLSLGLSGFGFWSHDISGFEKTASPDIYKRWVAFGMMSSHSRLHGNESYRVPWLFDEEAVDVLRFFTRLKCSLMPYLFAKAIDATTEGVPMMRAMVLEYTDDPTCATLDLQYMLGDSLLVAPIFNDESKAKYYLPDGSWTNFITGDVTEGGRWIKEKHSYMSIPLMVKENSIIAVGNENSKPDYDYADNVTLHVFELKDGTKVETTVYDTEAKENLNVNVTRKANEIIVEAIKAAKPYCVILRGIHNVAFVQGGNFKDDKLGTLVTPDKGASKLIISLK